MPLQIELWTLEGSSFELPYPTLHMQDASISLHHSLALPQFATSIPGLRPCRLTVVIAKADSTRGCKASV